jgi:hypothetical protein
MLGRKKAGERVEGRIATGLYIFFLPPFFPLEMRLFLPTAMVAEQESELRGSCYAMIRLEKRELRVRRRALMAALAVRPKP